MWHSLVRANHTIRVLEDNLHRPPARIMRACPSSCHCAHRLYREGGITHARTVCHTVGARTHTRTLARSRSLARPHIRALSLSLSHTHTHTQPRRCAMLMPATRAGGGVSSSGGGKGGRTVQDVPPHHRALRPPGTRTPPHAPRHQPTANTWACGAPRNTRMGSGAAAHRAP